MNCTQTRDWLARGALEPEAPSPQAEAHLAECAACRSARDGLAALAHWGPQEPPLGLAEKTLRAVQAEPAQQFWVDRWLAAVSHWLQSRHPVTAIAMACALFVLVLGPNMMRGRAQGALTGCQANLRTLALALDDYARSHAGRYPAGLAELPITQPRCPSTDTSTYVLSVSPDERAYTVICAGHHHQRENYPQYSSVRGPQGETRN